MQQHLVSEFNLESIAFFAAVVHLAAIIIVHFTKYFVCQWAPLTGWNIVLAVLRKPKAMVLCDRTRKGATQLWAWAVAYFISLYIWPVGLFPTEWALSQHQIAAINAILNPLLVWGLFVVLGSNGKTRPLAEFFGAKVLDLKDAHQELQDAEGAIDAGKTIIRNVTGIGKPGVNP